MVDEVTRGESWKGANPTISTILDIVCNESIIQMVGEVTRGESWKGANPTISTILDLKRS
jgi:hypothetical protein